MRRLSCAMAGALVAGSLLPASLPATESVTPFTRDFGSVATGTSSSVVSFHLTTLCEDDPEQFFYQCVNPGGDPPLPIDISVSGGFAQTNDCPAEMPRASGPGGEPLSATCTIHVNFSPPAAGGFEGFLRTGNTPENPIAAISGTGVIPAPPAAPKKKCKKKKKGAAPAKKKCGKKRKKK
jgi:hypothetical protein